MSSEIKRLKRKLAEFERNSKKTSWLLRQLWGKMRHFPRDLSRRLRNSAEKRRASRKINATLAGKAGTPGAASLPAEPFHIIGENLPAYEAAIATDEASRRFVNDVRSFMASEEFARLVGHAAELDPDIGKLLATDRSYCPPLHDRDYGHMRQMFNAIPDGSYDHVVLMPAGRLGGADLVAAMLARALATSGRTLILRTDSDVWDRPDWYPPDVPSIDVSGALASMQDPRRALYCLLSYLQPTRIFNVNSRLAFDVFVTYGGRLASMSRLYAYFFCADRDKDGLETGYPVIYFPHIFGDLTAAIFDANDLAETLKARFRISPEQARKLRVIYTPSQLGAAIDLATRTGPEGVRSRKTVFWAGRLDRQKRFDLVIAAAREMPDVEFRCWGKAVLDSPPDLARLPKNLKLNAPFKDYAELPLSECDLWLYTSAWDGLPTILIELGALGVPMAASAAGGVPELVDDSTGWPIPVDAEAGDIAQIIRAALDDPAGRVSRARALHNRVRTRHDIATFIEQVNSL